MMRGDVQDITPNETPRRAGTMLRKFLDIFPVVSDILHKKKNDDAFVSSNLHARVLSGKFFEIHISALQNQILTLHSDHKIGENVLKAWTEISEISAKRIQAPIDGRQSRPIEKVSITFSCGWELFEANEAEFNSLLKLSLHTSKTLSLSCRAEDAPNTNK